MIKYLPLLLATTLTVVGQQSTIQSIVPILSSNAIVNALGFTPASASGGGTYIGIKNGIGTNSVIFATNNTGIVVTNYTGYAPADAPQLNLFIGTNAGQLNISPNQSTTGSPVIAGDSYFTVRIDPTHNSNPVGSVGNSETILSANQFAFLGRHFQIGSESDLVSTGYLPYWYFQSLNPVSISVVTNYSVPCFWTTRGWVNNASQVHSPGIYAKYETTNGPNGTYKFALAFDSDAGFLNVGGPNANPDMVGIGTNDAIRLWSGNSRRVEIVSNLVASAGMTVSNGNLTVNFSTGDPVISMQPLNSVVQVGSSTKNAEFEVVGTAGSSAEYFRSGQFGNFIVTGGLSIGGYRGFATDVGATLYNIGTFTNVGLVTVTGGISSTRSNALALTQITFPNTTVPWTNTLNCNIVMYIDNTGVTGTAVKENGTTIASSILSGDIITMLMQPGDYLSVTYTIGTPVGKWKPF